MTKSSSIVHLAADSKNTNNNYHITGWILASLFEFFYNSLFPAKSWQDPAGIDGEEQNKKVAPTGDWTHNLQIISLMLYWLC